MSARCASYRATLNRTSIAVGGRETELCSFLTNKRLAEAKLSLYYFLFARVDAEGGRRTCRGGYDVWRRWG